MPLIHTRRRFVTTLSLAGATSLICAPPVMGGARALETTTVRIVNDGSIYIAPLFAAEELLRAEGFTDVRYPKIAAGAQVDEGLARGAADFSVFVPFEHMPALDVGAPITVLAGVHVGCFELFAHQGIHKITDLKGKTVGLHASPISLLTLSRPSRNQTGISNALHPRPYGLFLDDLPITSARIFPQRGCKLNEPNGFEPLRRVHDRIIRVFWPINFAHKR